VTISPHPEPYYTDATIALHHGDCLDVLRTLPDASVDAVVTDPPYELTANKKGGTGTASVNLDSPYGRARIGTGNGSGGFMGKAWDSTGIAFDPELWREALRVLKPGGHLLAFGGTRTWHRLACAVEDAGFEVRDSIAWMHGSGFPKNLDVSKAIDAHLAKVPKAQEAAARNAPYRDTRGRQGGLGTALKPAFEPIVVARKPLIGTVAANVLAHGTGALNIDECRIEGEVPQVTQGLSSDPSSWEHRTERRLSNPHAAGRWPANVILDEDQADALDEQSGILTSGKMLPTHTTAGVDGRASAYGADAVGGFTTMETYGDAGGASRFFYTAKADAGERPRVDGIAHPTVKPLSLMRWLVRLVTPPGGTVLEPFAGSGTTVEACILEGFRCIAIEREADYLPLIVQRIQRRLDPLAAVKANGGDGGLFDLLGEASA
jgi:DNA modification methylase